MSYGPWREFFRMMRSEVRAAKGIRIKLVILLYRLASYGVNKGGLTHAITFPVNVLYRLYSEFLLGIELPVRVVAGPGLLIYHGYGLVVHVDTKIGARCTLRQGVTLGNKITRGGVVTAPPVIGDDVEFGAGSVVLGPISIGSRVSVGACTAVTKDVPDDSVVVGMGMRFINQKKEGVC